MDHFILTVKAYRIRKQYNTYKRMKDNSIRAERGETPVLTWRDKYSQYFKRLRLKIRRVLLFCCPPNSSIYKFGFKLRRDGTFENFIFKSLVGFLGGILLTYIFFMFFVFQLNFTLSSATVICFLLGLILSIGLAFSHKVRCFTFLLLPVFFSKRGRQAMMAYAFILALTGPAKNTLHNMGVLSESLACGQEQLKQAAKQIVEMAKQPFYAIRDAVKDIMKTVRKIVDKIKDILLAIKRIVLAIVNVIKTAAQWLGSIVNFCNKKVGTPFQRCTRVMDGAVLDCQAKLGPMWGWLCSVAYIGHALCYVVKFLDFICMLLDFIGDIGSAVVKKIKRKVTEFSRHIKSIFYISIDFSHSFHFESNQSRSMKEVTEGMVTEIKHRTDRFLTLFDWMSFAFSFFFLFILFRVWHYRHKFLTSDHFDNHYIRADFRLLDMRRAAMDQETVLPLNHRERRKYIRTTSLRLVQSERAKLAKSVVFLAVTSVKLLIHLLTDYCLYWVLSKIRYYGRFQTKMPPNNMVTLHVEGKGVLADLYRSTVKAFSPAGLNTEMDTIPCLPDPLPPNTGRYIQIVSLIGMCWVLALLEPYGLRMRNVIMSFYYVDRAQQRTVWLYNNIIRSRGNFLKLSRRHLRRTAKGLAGEGPDDKVTFKEWVRAECPLLDRLGLLGKSRQEMCLLCGRVAREDDQDQLVHCGTPGCMGLFCQECFKDLNNTCTVCKDPVQYGDPSDMSLEKDSSDESAGRVRNRRKSPGLFQAKIPRDDVEKRLLDTSEEEGETKSDLSYDYQNRDFSQVPADRSDQAVFKDVEKQSRGSRASLKDLQEAKGTDSPSEGEVSPLDKVWKRLKAVKWRRNRADNEGKTWKSRFKRRRIRRAQDRDHPASVLRRMIKNIFTKRRTESPGGISSDDRSPLLGSSEKDPSSATESESSLWKPSPPARVESLARPPPTGRGLASPLYTDRGLLPPERGHKSREALQLMPPTDEQKLLKSAQPNTAKSKTMNQNNDDLFKQNLTVAYLTRPKPDKTLENQHSMSANYQSRSSNPIADRYKVSLDANDTSVAPLPDNPAQMNNLQNLYMCSSMAHIWRKRDEPFLSEDNTPLFLNSTTYKSKLSHLQPSTETRSLAEMPEEDASQTLQPSLEVTQPMPSNYRKNIILQRQRFNQNSLKYGYIKSDAATKTHTTAIASPTQISRTRYLQTISENKQHRPASQAPAGFSGELRDKSCHRQPIPGSIQSVPSTQIPAQTHIGTSPLTEHSTKYVPRILNNHDSPTYSSIQPSNVGFTHLHPQSLPNTSTPTTTSSAIYCQMNNHQQTDKRTAETHSHDMATSPQPQTRKPEHRQSVFKTTSITPNYNSHESVSKQSGENLSQSKNKPPAFNSYRNIALQRTLPSFLQSYSENKLTLGPSRYAETRNAWRHSADSYQHLPDNKHTASSHMSLETPTMKTRPEQSSKHTQSTSIHDHKNVFTNTQRIELSQSPSFGQQNCKGPSNSEYKRTFVKQNQNEKSLDDKITPPGHLDSSCYKDTLLKHGQVQPRHMFSTQVQPSMKINENVSQVSYKLASVQRVKDRFNELSSERKENRQLSNNYDKNYSSNQALIRKDSILHFEDKQPVFPKINDENTSLLKEHELKVSNSTVTDRVQRPPKLKSDQLTVRSSSNKKPRSVEEPWSVWQIKKGTERNEGNEERQQQSGVMKEALLVPMLCDGREEKSGLKMNNSQSVNIPSSIHLSSQHQVWVLSTFNRNIPAKQIEESAANNRFDEIKYSKCIGNERNFHPGKGDRLNESSSTRTEYMPKFGSLADTTACSVSPTGAVLRSDVSLGKTSTAKEDIEGDRKHKQSLGKTSSTQSAKQLGSTAVTVPKQGMSCSHFPKGCTSTFLVQIGHVPEVREMKPNQYSECKRKAYPWHPDNVPMAYAVPHITVMKELQQYFDAGDQMPAVPSDGSSEELLSTSRAGNPASDNRVELTSSSTEFLTAHDQCSLGRTRNRPSLDGYLGSESSDGGTSNNSGARRGRRPSSVGFRDSRVAGVAQRCRLHRRQKEESPTKTTSMEKLATATSAWMVRLVKMIQGKLPDVPGLTRNETEERASSLDLRRNPVTNNTKPKLAGNIYGPLNYTNRKNNSEQSPPPRPSHQKKNDSAHGSSYSTCTTTSIMRETGDSPQLRGVHKSATSTVSSSVYDSPSSTIITTRRHGEGSLSNGYESPKSDWAEAKVGRVDGNRSKAGLAKKHQQTSNKGAGKKEFTQVSGRLLRPLVTRLSQPRKSSPRTKTQQTDSIKMARRRTTKVSTGLKGIANLPCFKNLRENYMSTKQGRNDVAAKTVYSDSSSAETASQIHSAKLPQESYNENSSLNKKVGLDALERTLVKDEEVTDGEQSSTSRAYDTPFTTDEELANEEQSSLSKLYDTSFTTDEELANEEKSSLSKLYDTSFTTDEELANEEESSLSKLYDTSFTTDGSFTDQSSQLYRKLHQTEGKTSARDESSSYSTIGYDTYTPADQHPISECESQSTVVSYPRKRSQLSAEISNSYSFSAYGQPSTEGKLIPEIPESSFGEKRSPLLIQTGDFSDSSHQYVRHFTADTDFPTLDGSQVKQLPSAKSQQTGTNMNVPGSLASDSSHVYGTSLASASPHVYDTPLASASPHVYGTSLASASLHVYDTPLASASSHVHGTSLASASPHVYDTPLASASSHVHGTSLASASPHVYDTPLASASSHVHGTSLASASPHVYDTPLASALPHVYGTSLASPLPHVYGTPLASASSHVYDTPLASPLPHMYNTPLAFASSHVYDTPYTTDQEPSAVGDIFMSPRSTQTRHLDENSLQGYDDKQAISYPPTRLSVSSQQPDGFECSTHPTPEYDVTVNIEMSTDVPIMHRKSPRTSVCCSGHNRSYNSTSYRNVIWKLPDRKQSHLSSITTYPVWSKSTSISKYNKQLRHDEDTDSPSKCREASVKTALFPHSHPLVGASPQPRGSLVQHIGPSDVNPLPYRRSLSEPQSCPRAMEGHGGTSSTRDPSAKHAESSGPGRRPDELKILPFQGHPAYTDMIAELKHQFSQQQKPQTWSRQCPRRRPLNRGDHFLSLLRTRRQSLSRHQLGEGVSSLPQNLPIHSSRSTAQCEQAMVYHQQSNSTERSEMRRCSLSTRDDKYSSKPVRNEQRQSVNLTEGKKENFGTTNITESVANTKYADPKYKVKENVYYVTSLYQASALGENVGHHSNKKINKILPDEKQYLGSNQLFNPTHCVSKSAVVSTTKDNRANSSLVGKETETTSISEPILDTRSDNQFTFHLNQSSLGPGDSRTATVRKTVFREQSAKPMQSLMSRVGVSTTLPFSAQAPNHRWSPHSLVKPHRRENDVTEDASCGPSPSGRSDACQRRECVSDDTNQTQDCRKKKDGVRCAAGGSVWCYRQDHEPGVRGDRGTESRRSEARDRVLQWFADIDRVGYQQRTGHGEQNTTDQSQHISFQSSKPF